MPAQRFDLIASISGAAAATGTVTPSEAPTVSISFERRPVTTGEPPFEAPGLTLEVYAIYQWSYNGANREVINFTDGDIYVTTEDDPSVEDRIRLGHANRAGVAVGALTGGSNGRFEQKLTLNPNSAGTVYLTVNGLAAAILLDTGGDLLVPVYGPLQAVVASFEYTTISGTQATTTKPEVDIIVPPGRPYTNGTAAISLLWNSPIRGVPNRPVPSNAADASIQLTNATYVAGSFMHTGATMTFNITVSGAGVAVITVKADSETDLAGDTGPPADVSESFYYDTTRSTPADSPTGTNVVTIYDSGSEAFNSTTDTILGTDAGAFKGVLDLALIDSNFYCTVQVQNPRRAGTVPQNELDQGSVARAELLRIPNSVGTTTVAKLKSYDSVLSGARSPVELGSRVYFFEGSYPFDGLGNLISVQKTGTSIQNHGIPWRSRLFNPNAINQNDNTTYARHIRTAAPIRALGSDLYLSAGYGDPRAAKSTDWESSENLEGLDAPETRIDNWSMLKWGSAFDFRLPVVQTNERVGYELLQELASLCFCYIGFDGNRLIFRPKFAPKATLTTSISPTETFTGASSIGYSSPNQVWPSSGLVWIVDGTKREIFSYGNRNSENNQIEQIQRAQFGTTAQELCPSTASLTYFDHVIDMEAHIEGPITGLTVNQDLQQLYNIIEISYGDPDESPVATKRNQSSIDSNKARDLELSVPLSHHDSSWADWLAQQYLDFYGEIRYLVQARLKLSPYLKIGQYIFLRETRNSLIDNQLFQIVRLTHTQSPYQTEVLLISIS